MKQNEHSSKLKIIPLGGLEQIGMNITALSMRTVLLLWIADCHSRKTTCMELIL